MLFGLSAVLFLPGGHGNLPFRISLTLLSCLFCNHCILKFSNPGSPARCGFAWKRCRLANTAFGRIHGQNHEETKALYRTRPLMDAVQSTRPRGSRGPDQSAP